MHDEHFNDFLESQNEFDHYHGMDNMIIKANSKSPIHIWTLKDDQEFGESV